MADIIFKLIEVKQRQKTEKIPDATIVIGDILNNSGHKITIDLPTVVTGAKRAVKAHYWGIGSYSGEVLKPGITQEMSFVIPTHKLSGLGSGDTISFQYRNGSDCDVYDYKVNFTSSGICYIVTYCYGRESSEYARMIAFRERVLAGQAWGKLIIRAYYSLSPEMIRRFPDSRLLPRLFRIAISAVLILDKTIFRGAAGNRLPRSEKTEAGTDRKING